MGDILKNNPILSHILIPLLLIFMVLSLIGKPYVDNRDSDVVWQSSVKMDQLIKNDSVILKTLKELR